MKISAAELRELLDYDPDTGVFKWRAQIGGGSNRGTKHIGYYMTAPEAHAAYVATKRILHPGNTL